MKSNLFNDIYIMIPVDVTNSNEITINKKVPDYINAYLNCIRENSEYECDKKISESIKREYLGTYRFLLMDDTYNKVVREIDVDLILTLHCNTKLGVINLLFKNTDNITQIEDQMSSKHLFFSIDGNLIEVRQLLKNEFGLIQCGDEKVLVCLKQKPETELELCYILAAESYNSVHIDYKVKSQEIMNAASNNIAEYDFYEAYASDSCVVYISPKIDMNFISNITVEAAIIFICEIVILQNSAISRTNSRIVDELTDNIDISLKTIEKMYVEFGRTIILWDKTYIITASHKN